MFHKSEIFKNAVSERWCSDSRQIVGFPMWRLKYPHVAVQYCHVDSIFNALFHDCMVINFKFGEVGKVVSVLLLAFLSTFSQCTVQLNTMFDFVLDSGL